jgi:glycosyltransferase involved in cell wall biosynthesis
MDSLYEQADIVVLTSQSEGIPLVLMEAMARGNIVLAPAITGIPELVTSGKTGFLYRPASLKDFIAKVFVIQALMLRRDSRQRSQILSAANRLDWVRHAAQIQVRHNFNRKKNLEKFGDLFLQLTAKRARSLPHEDLVLQQIQLPV